MQFDVLVVDDVEDAAVEFAQVIRDATGLSVGVATNSEAALVIARENPIKVAVLDEHIGATEFGSDLLIQLRENDAKIRAVMFSAFAGDANPSHVVEMGYGSVLRKTELRRLGTVVADQYLLYEREDMRRKIVADQSLLLRVKHGVWPRRKSVRYFLTDVLMSEQPESAWQWETVAALDVGASVTEEDTIEITWEFALEEEQTATIGSSLNLSVPKMKMLKGALTAEIAARLKRSQSLGVVSTKVRQKKLELPPEPGDVNIRHVISRRLDRAKIFLDCRVTVLVTCECCGSVDLAICNGSFPAGRVETRQVDTWSDQVTQTTRTGPIYPGPNSVDL